VLHIASSTVDVHRRNIMRKLNLHSVAELTRYVINHERGIS
jgi:two-component system NarL family response regulator